MTTPNAGLKPRMGATDRHFTLVVPPQARIGRRRSNDEEVVVVVVVCESGLPNVDGL
jgi:hypothetical protein